MTGNALISRAGLARLAGCSKAAVTQRCRTELAPACIGGRVDLSHPGAHAFLARHRVLAEDVAAAVANDRPPGVLISADLLKLELRQLLALHAPGYQPGEPAKLGTLLKACRRMVAQLAANELSARREQVDQVSTD